MGRTVHRQKSHQAMGPFMLLLTVLHNPVLCWNGDFSDLKSHSESYKPFLTKPFFKANPYINLFLMVMFLSNERSSIDSLENPFRSDFYCIVLTDLQGVENYA